MNESHDSEANEIPPVRPKRRIGRLIFRALARIIVVLFFLIVLAVALFGFRPISISWAEHILKERFLATTGLQLDFERAKWTLGRGHLFIGAPTLSDPSVHDRLLELKAVELDLSVASIFRHWWSPKDFIEVRQLSVRGPLEVEVEEREGRVQLAEKSRRVQEIFQAKLKAASDEATGGQTSSTTLSKPPSAPVRLTSVNLAGLGITLKNVGEKETKTLLLARDADVLAEFNGSNAPTNILCTGKLEGQGGSTGFKLRLGPNLERNEMSLNLTLQPLDSRLHLPTAPPADFRTGAMEITGMLRRKEDQAGKPSPNANDREWSLFSEANLSEITFIGAGADGSDQRFESASLFTSLDWSTSEKALKLNSAQFKSKDCAMTADGRLDLFDPYRYALHLDPLELRSQGLALVERNVLRGNYIVKPEDSRIEVRGELAGRLGELPPETENLTYKAENLALQLPDFPEPITNLRIQGSVTPKELKLADGYAVVQGIPFQVAGSFRGRPLEGKIDHAELNWKTAGEVEGLSKLIEKNGEGLVSQFSFRGDVMGSGSVHIENPELGDWEKLLDKADLQGKLQFNQAELNYRKLDRPIRGLSGTFEMSRNQAVFHNLSGSIEDVDFALDGVIAGRKHFWDEATTTATLQTRLHLENIGHYFEWVGTDPPENLPKSEGRAILNARIAGPLNEWRRMDFRGDLILEDLALPLDTDLVGGTIRSPRIEAAFTPSEIRLVKAAGDWEGVALGVEGTLGVDAGEITLKMEGPLVGFQKAVPAVLDRFEVGGSASLRHTLKLARADREKLPAKTFVALWPADPENKATTPTLDLKTMWLTEGKGQIQFKNAEMTFECMPTHLTDVNGTLNYDANHLWSPGLVQVRAGDHARETQTTIVVTFGKESAPTIMDAHVIGDNVDLDDWIQDWRRPRPHPKEKEKPTNLNQPRFIANVTAETKEVGYRGLKGKNLTGSLQYKDFGKGHDDLSWTDARAEAKKGWVLVNGIWKRRPGMDITTYDIKASKMDVADLLNAFYKPKKQTGLSTGLVTGTLYLHQDGLEGVPFDGHGELFVEDSKFVSNAIFGKLGSLLKLEELFNEISFPKIQGRFDVSENSVTIKGDKPIVFENPSMIHPLSLKTHGKVGPERALDLELSLQFFPRIGGIPVVGQVWDIVNKLTGSILRFHVGGTLDEPEVSALPRIKP